MLSKLDFPYRILAKQPPATPNQIHSFINHESAVARVLVMRVKHLCDTP